MTRSIQFFIFIFMILIFLSKGFTSQSLDETQEPSPKLQSIKPFLLPSEEPDLEFSLFLHIPEILTHIVGRVEIRDLLSLSAVSRPLHRSIEEIFEIFAKKDFCLDNEDKITTWRQTYGLYSFFWQSQNHFGPVSIFSRHGIYLADLQNHLHIFLEEVIKLSSTLLSPSIKIEALKLPKFLQKLQPFATQKAGLTAKLIQNAVKLEDVAIADFLWKVRT